MPVLLDLFCGAGGAAVGYSRAGFTVVGVDIAPQPRFPFDFHQDDAIDFVLNHADQFDAIHASPPCQPHSAMSVCRPGLAGQYIDLLDATRKVLAATGKPWVIENVPGSGIPTQPTLDGAQGIVLCGHMFGLELYRHRLFECSHPLTEPPHPRHEKMGGRAGHWKPGEIISVSGHCAPIEVAKAAMGIDWMRREELAESIPPAYTEFIGSQLQEIIPRAFPSCDFGNAEQSALF